MMFMSSGSIPRAFCLSMITLGIAVHPASMIVFDHFFRLPESHWPLWTALLSLLSLSVVPFWSVQRHYDFNSHVMQPPSGDTVYWGYFILWMLLMNLSWLR